MTERTIDLVAPPPIPNKYDIIPIHASDIASFLRCRRYWHWSSPAKLNLRRRVDIHGINMPLWFGSGIHYALEMYYNPFLRRDPVEAFKTWYQYQWEGGVVTEDWLERTYDAHPVDLGEQTPQAKNAEGQYDDAGTDVHLWEVRGLQDLHPDPDHLEFEQHFELGVGMMEWYKEYAAKHDDFVVIAAESTFSVPLGFEAIDTREESPNYGKLVEVHARGKRDAIIYKPSTDAFAVMDHKTAESIGEEYFTKLENDAQVSTYMWASQEEAKLHDLPYKRIDHCLYNVLRKNYPKPPSILSDGISPSVNKQTEGTTAELFMAYLEDSGLKPLFDATKKWQDYYDYLLKQGDSLFIERKNVIRNKYETETTGNEIRMVAREMLREDLQIYKTPSSSYSCTRCQFRVPCLLADQGGDFIAVLSDAYEENRGR